MMIRTYTAVNKGRKQINDSSCHKRKTFQISLVSRLSYILNDVICDVFALIIHHTGHTYITVK